MRPNTHSVGLSSTSAIGPDSGPKTKTTAPSGPPMPPADAPHTRVGAGSSGAGRFNKMGKEFKNKKEQQAHHKSASSGTPVTGNLIDLSDGENSPPPIPYQSKPKMPSAKHEGHAEVSSEHHSMQTGRPPTEGSVGLEGRENAPPLQHTPHNGTAPPPSSHTESHPVPSHNPATLMQQQTDMHNQQMQMNMQNQQHQMQMQHDQMQMSMNMQHQQMQMQMQNQQMQQMQQILSQAGQAGAKFSPQEMQLVKEMSMDPSRQHELMQFVMNKTMEGTYEKIMMEQVMHSLKSFAEAHKEGNAIASSAI